MNTKTFLKLTGAIALATCFSAPAQAGFITGAIEFSGSVTLTGAPGIDTTTAAGFQAATALDFLIAETNFFTQTGDYSAVQGNLTVTYNDFTFDVFSGPISPLWTFTDPDDSKVYSFDLASISIDTHNGDFLNLSGTGTLNATGFDATPGRWTLTTQRNNQTANISFSSGNSSVPEPMSLSLLGIGIATLAAKRKTKLAFA